MIVFVHSYFVFFVHFYIDFCSHLSKKLNMGKPHTNNLHFYVPFFSGVYSIGEERTVIISIPISLIYSIFECMVVLWESIPCAIKYSKFDL